MKKEWGRYLFEYRYEGATWCFELIATSQADAEARFKALAWAQFKGGPCETIPVSSPRFWFVPLTVLWRNWWVAEKA